MIDRDTAVRWANDCAVWVDSHGQSVVASVDALERLINRAMNEAYERAAAECDKLSEHANFPDDIDGYVCAAAIRKLKQGNK